MSLTWTGKSKVYVISYDTQSLFPTIGVKDVIYIDDSVNAIYRWDGSAYEELGQYPIVATYADLPAASLNNGKIYVVTTSTGIWPFNHPAGFYISNGITWTEIPATAGAITYADLFASNPITYDGAGTYGLNWNTTNLKLTSSALNTIQDIALSSSPQFTGLNLSGLTASSLIYTDGSKNLASVTIGTGLNFTAGTLSASGVIPGSIALNSGQIIVGNVSNVGAAVTMSGDITINNTGVSAIAANAVTNAKFRQSTALSVVGNSTNATANVADISAASDNQVLRRSGTALAFGAINLASSNAVTGILPNANTTADIANTPNAIMLRDSNGSFAAQKATLSDLIVGPSQSTILSNKVTLMGTNTNIAGPHVLAYTSTDQYPVFQQLNWAHDDVTQSFDAYYDGSGWKSGFGTSNAQISKFAGQLQFNFAHGVSQGSAITWTSAGFVDLATGTLNWNQPIKVANTTNSTSTTTGSWTTLGGAGISQDMYVGGTINAGGITIPSNNLIHVSNSRGSNTTGNGSYGAPYQTPSYALSQITTASSTNPFAIYVECDSYTESSWVLKPNICIIGNNAIINSTPSTFPITLDSSYLSTSSNTFIKDVHFVASSGVSFAYNLSSKSSGLTRLILDNVDAGGAAFNITGSSPASIATLPTDLFLRNCFWSITNISSSNSATLTNINCEVTNTLITTFTVENTSSASLSSSNCRINSGATFGSATFRTTGTQGLFVTINGMSRMPPSGWTIDGANVTVNMYNSYDRAPTLINSGTFAPTALFGGKVKIGASQTTTLDQQLTIMGPDSSTSGPHQIFYTGADSYPLFHHVNWAHNNVSLNFDSYYDGSNYKSSHSGSNYQIIKTSNQYQFNYASGVAQGSNITWTTAGYIDTSGILQWQKAIKTADTTDSSSITTGALISAGGIAAAKKAYFGDNVTIGASQTITLAQKLTLMGADTSGLGPHIIAYTSVDQYPVFQNLNFAHDNIALNFDMYWDGASNWRSSASGSNYQIYKNGNQLQFNYNSGTTAGSTVTFTKAGYIDTSGILQWQKAIKTADTTASSSTTTGSGVFAGGVGVAGTITVGTNLNLTGSTSKLTISTTAGNQGLDLATADSYANLRVIQNTTGASDKDLYLGLNSGATSSVRLYSNNALTVFVAGGQNLGLGATVFAGGTGVLSIQNASVVPPSTPVGYYALYVTGGALKGRGTSGTLTNIGNAEPHCKKCGSDFGLGWENPRYGGEMLVCKICETEYLENLRKCIKYIANDNKQALAEMQKFLSEDISHVVWNVDRTDQYKNIRIPTDVGKKMADKIANDSIVYHNNLYQQQHQQPLMQTI